MKDTTVTTERRHPGVGYAIPFFVVLAALTVVAFIIPLRPTQSYSEKRNLAEFPEFSLEALTSGSYFDDISTWFSDTFPGREGWLEVSAAVQELHGWSDVVIHGDIQISDPIPEIPSVPETTVPETQATQPETQPATETTEIPTEPELIAPPTTPVEEWGGIDAGEGADISLGAAIQIDDFAFTYYKFSQSGMDWYLSIVNKFAEKMQDTGIRIIHAMPPTAVGIMTENKYLEKLGCSPQDEALNYVRDHLAENVTYVDTFNALIGHNSEYLYFRTDHHWTALAAYYVYAELCETMGYDPAPLDTFEELDQGAFKGSLYYKCNKSNKLRVDNVIAYIPQGEITSVVYRTGEGGFEWPLISDMSSSNEGSKYMGFLGGDHALTVITNESLPDAPDCVVVKDSFGNAFVPFLTQNYHTVYAIDYRKYGSMSLSKFVEKYGVEDVIILPNLGMAQNGQVCQLLSSLLK